MPSALSRYVQTPAGLERVTLFQRNSPKPVMEHVGGARHRFDGKAPPADGGSVNFFFFFFFFF